MHFAVSGCIKSGLVDRFLGYGEKTQSSELGRCEHGSAGRSQNSRQAAFSCIAQPPFAANRASSTVWRNATQARGLFQMAVSSLRVRSDSVDADRCACALRTWENASTECNPLQRHSPASAESHSVDANRYASKQVPGPFRFKGSNDSHVPDTGIQTTAAFHYREHIPSM